MDSCCPIEIADGWLDYELIDAGGGEKLERWGEIITIRPDPLVIWPKSDAKLWNECHLHYHRSESGGGRWERKKNTGAESWAVSYKNFKFKIKPTDFKHMGLFPEQAVNWDWIGSQIKNARRPVRALNLFAYTGAATVACLGAGAETTHVDAAKGMNQWAKENISLSRLSEAKHRILADDAMKFLFREKRRGSRYDAIVMDPPAFGRGPSGEMWKLGEKLYDLVAACFDILSERPAFVLLNAYTSGLSPQVAFNILKSAARGANREGFVSCGEIGLKATTGAVLPCGLYGRWTCGR